MTTPLPPIPPRRAAGDRGLPPIPPRPRRAGAGLPPLAPRPPRGTGGLPPIAAPGPGDPPGPPPPRRPLARLPRGAAAGGLAVLALAAAGVVGGLAALSFDDDGRSQAVVAAPEPIRAGGGAGRPDLADAVAVVSPTVVQVRTDAGAQGSGVILAGSGLVVTNEHVVRGATSVRLDTDDGRTIAAVVERVDAAEDLAVLRPEVTAGQGAQLAGGALRPGDQVFAIGSPFQLQNSVTAGVVSAVGRVDPESGVPMIQIDAPINPGSSGGGLFDLSGHLVGIPTAILAPIRANVGIGFAVPVSRVQRLVESIP